MQGIDPTTGEPGPRYEPHDEAAINAKLDRSRQAFAAWRHSPMEERTAVLRNAARLLRDRAPELAELMASEMGKPVAQGRAEAEKCALVCEHYADHGPGYLAREPVETGARESFVSYQPLGTIFAIMPWNFPFWQVFRHAAPSLVAGNTIVLKHAENVPGCALTIERLLHDAGVPEGVFTTLLVDRNQAGRIIRDLRIAAVTLTGSTRAGRAVAQTAGEVLKKTVLELGGSDAYLILADADLDQAAEICAASRLINSGQSCIAAKRFIVIESVRQAFEERLVAAMAKARMGDPRLEETTVGPQARGDLRAEVHRQTRESIAQGARVLLGAELPEGPGFFYPPSVLTDVRPGMPAFDEEVFGPVAAITSARDEDEAIELANRSVYGLGGAVFTRDLERGREIAEKHLHAGACFVNALVRSDPRLPFGGVGDSGYGRELARNGILEFVNIKTVWLEDTGPTSGSPVAVTE